MLVANVSGLMGGGRAAATLDYMQQDISTATASAYTFSSVSFGSATATRIIVATIATRKSPAPGISSVSIGGVSATLYLAIHASGDDYSTVIAIATVPSGTTGDIVVTCSGTTLGCIINTFRLDGFSSAVPASQQSDATDPMSINVTCAANVAVICHAINYKTSSPTMSWSGAAGVVEQSDTFIASVMCASTAMILTTGSLSSANVDATPSLAFNHSSLQVITIQ